ncbi:polyprenyl synthetase family protein, partial [uncultured Muribaculum sp.]|uniref:polyprenyl synthetase family protein n=1 Tax=uncultured Muribaculum sp. TaxID=1918613 RepID=UPI0025A5A1D9
MKTSAEYIDSINRLIAGIPYPEEPHGLYEPIAYTLDCGGKRLRPMLLLASCDAVGGKMERAVNQALGIEMFHNFTLLHDDVMDRADKRRGKPTVHCKWNEATAILSGDAMLTMASQLMGSGCNDKLSEVLDLFQGTAMEIYEGQQYDMDFESRDDVTVAEYIEMIRLKTSVLLGCACRLGALMGGADIEIQEALYRYGISLGLAFQLQDDWLDTYGDPEVFGKNIGGDIMNDKKTFLLIHAFELASPEQKAVLNDWIGKTTFVAAEKIEAVTAIYNELHLKDITIAK